MSQAFEQVVHEISSMSPQEKHALRLLLDQQVTPTANNGGPAAFGWAKGRITMAPDFDEPLEELKDYME